MPRQLALVLCLAFIFWLFQRDKKLRPMSSPGLWVMLVWITIVGSRPVSLWFGTSVKMEEALNYVEGSPFDRNVFLILIVAGITVLLRRKLDWSGIFASNRWFFAFFLYCFISILWSDYPFVSFKRWTKELGNVIMVLILLSEQDPLQAIKAVFARFTYVVIPLSVLFIKYFSDIGRYYNNFTWTVSYGGITTNKNGLGSILIICGLFLVWNLIEMRIKNGKEKNTANLLTDIVLLLMVFWLLVKAHSSTAVVCLAFGSTILYFLRYPFAEKRVKGLVKYTVAAFLMVIVLYSFPAVTKTLVGMVGRDATFTGRTELWSELLKTPINPVLGRGYQSFWLGARQENMWELFAFHPVQAHNGYLETYLNLGVIGLLLLLAMIVSGAKKLKKEVLNGNSDSVFRLSLLIIVVVYNWTEAMFSGLTIIWVMLLMSALTCPRTSALMTEPQDAKSAFSYP